MRKLFLIIMTLAILPNVSCDTSNSGSSIKSKFKVSDVPQNVKNAKSELNATKESAIIVTLAPEKMTFIGENEYPFEQFGWYLNKLLEKTPAERQMIYLMASRSAEYAEVVSLLHLIRREKVENIGLIVSSEAKPNELFHVLKVKLMPEPKIEDSPEALSSLYLNVQKDGKISFGRYEEEGFKYDKDEIKPEELEAKIKQALKEREGKNETDKRIYVKATKQNQYAQIIRAVDASTGAGAEVYFVLDDLSD